MCSRMDCHPDGPGPGGEMGQEALYEIQKCQKNSLQMEECLLHGYKVEIDTCWGKALPKRTWGPIGQ